MVIGALIVVTGSMEPTINIKEMIIIKEQETYDVRDIVTYMDKNSNLVTHRIVSKLGNTVVTRGDNNSISDEPINLEKIEGKVCYHSNVLGEFFLYWLKPILGLIIVLLVFNMIKTIIKLNISRRKKDEGKV